MRSGVAIPTLALTLIACNGTAMPDITPPGATPTEYATLRDASGAVGFAETSLPTELAGGGFTPRRGASPVDEARVAGAWTLPADSDIDTLETAMRLHGTLSDAQTWRDGQLWTARLDAGSRRFMLLMIDGTHPRFARDQAAELRPAQARYLIAYRLD